MILMNNLQWITRVHAWHKHHNDAQKGHRMILYLIVGCPRVPGKCRVRTDVACTENKHTRGRSTEGDDPIPVTTFSDVVCENERERTVNNTS